MSTTGLDVGSGAPALKFADLGTKYEGRIIAAEERQATSFDDGKPEFYDDGKPVMEWVITLDIDGEEHRLFAKGQMKQAIREAVRAAGTTQLLLGGTLAVKWESTEPAKNPRHNPKKVYKARYTAPAPTGLSAEDF